MYVYGCMDVWMCVCGCMCMDVWMYGCVYVDVCVWMVGMSGVLSSELLRVLQILTLESNLLTVSSKEGEGMDDLYSIVQSTFAGGDDLESHADKN
jgi:hypothetical protein